MKHQKSFESGRRGAATDKDKQRSKKGWKEQRQFERRAEADTRNMAWRAKSYEEKLHELMNRPGECRRQIRKLIHEQLQSA